MSPEDTAARRMALALLGRRAYGEAELYAKFLEKGCPETEAAEAVGWLKELNYLDDEAYARGLARSCAERGYGEHRVRQELTRRGLDEAVVAAALEELPAAAETIEAVLARLARGKDLSDPAERRRVSAALYRRGFDWEDIRAYL